MSSFYQTNEQINVVLSRSGKPALWNAEGTSCRKRHEMQRYVVLLSRSSAGFKQGNDVDIVGVTGSIPVTPTIQPSTKSTPCLKSPVMEPGFA